jgi:sugar phosphate isomerase/epimerase
MYFGSKKALYERYALVKAAGFDSVMIWWGDSFYEKQEQLKLAEKYSLNVINAHLPFENINALWSDKLAGEDFGKWLNTELTDCAQHGVSTAVLHLSKGLNPPPFSNAGLDRIKRAVETCEHCEVNLALENLRHLDYLDYVMKNISSKRLGFCFDSGHKNYLSPNRDVLKDYRDRLFALHLNDNKGDDDTHMLPFDGTLDWSSVIRNLKDINYRGALSLEIQKDRHPIYSELTDEEYLSLAYKKALKLEQLLLI